jgi:hypothetical protein
MSSRPRLRSLLSTLVVCCGVTTGIAVAQSSERVATGGDPYLVTPDRLQQELAAAGVQIEYARPARSRSTVSGVASLGHASVGFEFQIFPGSDGATVRGLGKLGLRHFDWRRPRGLFDLRKSIRGVLANVAYAQYELELLEAHDPPGTYLRRDRQRRRLRRALDDALFNAFPSNDR